jgi:hypothetical protein
MAELYEGPLALPTTLLLAIFGANDKALTPRRSGSTAEITTFTGVPGKGFDGQSYFHNRNQTPFRFGKESTKLEQERTGKAKAERPQRQGGP